MMAWTSILVASGRGSEDGVVLRDEEHDDGARITLERETRVAPFAITCGIYGWMMHTRFFGAETEAIAGYDAMRAELSDICAALPLKGEADEAVKTSNAMKAIAAFVEKYP
jgi:hypothetical protein